MKIPKEDYLKRIKLLTSSPVTVLHNKVVLEGKEYLNLHDLWNKLLERKTMEKLIIENRKFKTKAKKAIVKFHNKQVIPRTPKGWKLFLVVIIVGVLVLTIKALTLY